MRRLDPIHKEFLLRESIISAIVGTILCAIISFAAFQSQDVIMFWGENGLFFDTLLTVFFMPFMMTLIMTPMYRTRVADGKAPATRWSRHEHFMLRLFPGSLFFRALIVAILLSVVLLPVSTAILLSLENFPMSFDRMLMFKSIYGALIGFLVTPLIAICAMADKGAVGGAIGLRP